MIPEATAARRAASDVRALEAWHMLLGIEHAVRQADARSPLSRAIPFTLVSGFLGSGKTTLLQRMLEHPAGRRIAVLVNDFGAVNIDAALIRTRTTAVLELSNGCACCSLAAGLAQTLADLLARSPTPDAIVMEASGIAEPLGILHVALSNPGVALNAVITIVDARHVRRQLEDPLARDTIKQQILAADLVVLNKKDLLDAYGLAQARTSILSMAPGIRTVEAAYGDIPAELLLDIELAADANTHLASRPPSHHTPYRSYVLDTPGALDQRLLCSLVSELPAVILRAKGFVRLAHDPSRHYLLEAVGRRWSLLAQQPGRAYPSGLVVIGTPDAIELQNLRDGLKTCEVMPDPAS